MTHFLLIVGSLIVAYVGIGFVCFGEGRRRGELSAEHEVREAIDNGRPFHLGMATFRGRRVKAIR